MAFLARRIISLNVNLADLLTPANTAIVLAMSLASVIVIFINSFCWRLCLGLFSNVKVPVYETFSVYARANILKYLPGNVGHYAGRQLYGASLGIKQFQLATATILELLYSTLVMLLCAFCFSLEDVIQALREWAADGTLVWIGAAAVPAVLILCTILLVFRKNEHILTLFGLLRLARSWGVFLVCMMLNAVGTLIIAGEYIILLRQYITLELHSVFRILSVNFVAIFVGFITPGVPGGIGVRETVLTAALSHYYPEDVVILAACSQRIAIFLMDLLAVPVSGLLLRRRNTAISKYKKSTD